MSDPIHPEIDIERETGKLELFSLLNEVAGPAYEERLTTQPRLSEFADEQSSNLASVFLEIDSKQELAPHRDLLTLGARGIIAVTARSDPAEDGGFSIPQLRTMLETLRNLTDYYEGNTGRALHEWSLIGLHAITIESALGEQAAFSNPDAQLGFIFATLASKEFTIGWLGMDGLKDESPEDSGA